MLFQEFSERGSGNDPMRGVERLPKFFTVSKGASIVAT
jgi:hypothetical protein